MLIALVALAVFVLVFASSADAATTSQAKLRKSETVVAWYKGPGRWHLRPRYTFCADLRSPLSAGRCWRHRENLRWHRARVARLTPRPTLSHLAGWLCIHSREGAWKDSGDPYWGGLQMGWGFMRAYGGSLLKKGPASNWTPLEQMAVAEGGFVMNGGSHSWMRSQWPMTFPPCAHLF